MEEIQSAVRTAIQQCCVQLKSKIARQQAAREQRQRKKNLTKYIPNVASALYTVLQAVAARRGQGPAGELVGSSEAADPPCLLCPPPCLHSCRAGQASVAAQAQHGRCLFLQPSGGGASLGGDCAGCIPTLFNSAILHARIAASDAAKRRRLDVEEQLVVAGVQSGEVTEARLAAKLSEHVEQIDVDMVS